MSRCWRAGVREMDRIGAPQNADLERATDAAFGAVRWIEDFCKIVNEKRKRHNKEIQDRSR